MANVKFSRGSVSRVFITAVAVLVIVGVWFFARQNNIPETTEADTEVTRAAFNPNNFVNPLDVTNEYFPLTPGMQWVRSGTTEVGSRKIPHQIVTTMTDVIKMIDGVPAIAMLDESTDSGEVIQVGFDYLAIDKDGNVWILGGYTEEYQGGEFVFSADAFLGESHGAQVGILAPAVVTMDTPRWFIGSSGPKEDPSIGEPVEIGSDVTIPFGDFSNVRVVREGEIDAPDNEFKYYAPGVGVIWNVPQDESLHQDYFELTNFTQLSPEGLAEKSQVVLNLESHAKTEAPEVYGNAPFAKQLLPNGLIVDRATTLETPTETESREIVDETSEQSTKSLASSAEEKPLPAISTPPPSLESAQPVQELASKKLSESEAKAIALKKVPGEITDIAIEKFKGKDAYFVEVAADNGPETDVVIDIDTGEVLRVES
jgi:uncharacterized membrane protein YkoI